VQFEADDELLLYAKKLEGLKLLELGKSIGRLDLVHRKHTKGLIGQLIEKEYFRIPTNSSENPDFENLGIELKVTPLKVLKSGLLNVKERVPIKMIDYFDVYENENWEDSKIFKKLNKILFIFYIHDNSLSAIDWQIVRAFIWSPSSIQKKYIQNDYEILRKKILLGERNSEGDHSFLGNCPKHGKGFNKGNPSKSTPSTLRKHPKIKYAEARGYCLRERALDSILSDDLGKPLVKRGAGTGLLKSYFSLESEGISYESPQKIIDDF